jgi:hypothetical protein
VGNPSEAIPARPLLINHTYDCFMAADAVRQQDFFAVFCDLYPLGCQAGKKETYVFYAVDRFPDVVEGNMLVRQMAINAFISSVRTGVRPCLILCVHHVAAAAEDRCLGPRQKLWWTQQQEKDYGSSCHYYNGKIPYNFFRFSITHISTPLLKKVTGSSMVCLWIFSGSLIECASAL